MLCPNCGTENQSTSRFCSSCGNQLPVDEETATDTNGSSGGEADASLAKEEDTANAETDSSATPENNAAAEEATPGEALKSEETATLPQEETGEQEAVKSCRTVLKLLFLAILVCFFFPFVTVSCAGQTEELSGVNLLFASFSENIDNAAGFDADVPIESGEELSGFDRFRLDHNIVLIIAVVFALGGLVTASGDKMKELIGSALFTAGSLLAFRLLFLEYYNVAEEYREMVGAMIEFSWGWWVAFLLALAAVAVALIGYVVQKE